MSLGLMYRDELTGFARSRVMLVLWIGMPVLAIVLHAIQPDLEGQMSVTVFTTLLISSMSSTLAAVMLSVGIVHEKTRGVYSLFLVRPVKRRSIILGKFLAVFTCVGVASLLTLLVGAGADLLAGRALDRLVLVEVGKSAATGFSTIAITSAAGILIGVLAPSVLVGVILVIYGANQLSVVGFLPVLLHLEPGWFFAIGIGCTFTVVLLTVAVTAFNRRQF
jgi:ABC-2 type transport system permease protein